MADLTPVEIQVLRDHAKAIVHMRRQKDEGRFGLVFGAGIGLDIDLPNWSDLVQRIADHPKISGRDAIQDIEGIDQSLAIQIQKLYEWYRMRRISGRGDEGDIFHHREKALIAQWREIVTECLYRDQEADFTPEKIKNKHPYLTEYVPLIELSDVTVNYNFDETLQLLMAGSETSRTGRKQFQRRFKTISKGAMRARAIYPVIYHPNGFLPRNLIESTDPIVFTEESFADQLLQMTQNREDFLMSHFGAKTCLLIGLSLSDANLKHLLRRNATANPGQCHYYVCFCDRNKPGDGARKALLHANFQVYNLVTLFLNRKEIAALGTLLSMSDDSLRQAAEELNINLKYLFYVTGPMGVGKSTCLSNLYSLTTYD